MMLVKPKTYAMAIPPTAAKMSMGSHPKAESIESANVVAVLLNVAPGANFTVSIACWARPRPTTPTKRMTTKLITRRGRSSSMFCSTPLSELRWGLLSIKGFPKES